jgi:hypothetical protein
VDVWGSQNGIGIKFDRGKTWIVEVVWSIMQLAVSIVLRIVKNRLFGEILDQAKVS